MKIIFLLSILSYPGFVESFAHSRSPLSSLAMPQRNKNVFLAASSTTEETSSSSSSSSEDAPSISKTKLLKRDRYIASNRFAVRRGKEVKFENRWANRKSRLAELDGFRYFHLMRRVTLEDDDNVKYDGGHDKDSPEGNYVSLTVWQDKSNFNAWRKGDAFREAHGGTSIRAFLSTMVSSIRILRGAPKPAFYDGLLVQSEAPEFMPETVDGWRNVEFPKDGSTLPVECFVACNQFFVSKENAVAFEQRWANRESKLRSCEGFVSFAMMRRDAKTKTHGSTEMDESTEPTYVSTTIWKDRESFQKWRTGSNFSKAHGQKAVENNKDKVNEKESKENETPKKPSQAAAGAPLWSRPPKPIFYEGTLVISNADGA